MRRFAASAGAVLIILLFFSGCTGNLFTEWDKPEIPSSSELDDNALSDPEGFISDVGDYLDGGAIDEDNAGDVIGALNIIYDPSGYDPETPGTEPADPTEQQAALLIGEVAIAGNENAGEVVDNLAGVLTSIADGTAVDPEAFIRSLIPAGLSTPEFNAMVNALLEAGEAYLAFGESIGEDATGEDVPFMSNADIGDTLNRAAAGIAVIAALDALDGSLDGTITDLAVQTTALEAIVNGGSYGGPDPTAAFDGSIPAYDGAQNLLDLAGFDVS